MPARLALETTLLVHGVPREDAKGLAGDLARIARQQGVEPALIGVVGGAAVAGMSIEQLDTLLGSTDVPKANAANLGVLMCRGSHAATTVSATVEIAASEGIQVFATGGLGGVHPRLNERMDISSDLVSLTRHAVAVVCSGVKSILDVASTRELLETLGVPVVGYKTSDFPAFYLRKVPNQHVGVDARFDDLDELARFVKFELGRSGRGVVVANPIPAGDELSADEFQRWLDEAEREALQEGAEGRAVTPAVLSKLHEVSKGKTLQANLALVKHNTLLGALIARRLGSD